VARRRHLRPRLRHRRNGVADIGEPPLATYVTNSTGYYLFDNLPPGD